MKKYLLIITLIACFGLAKAQINVPNGGFEKWDTTLLFSQPQHFYTSNDQLNSFTGLSNVIRSTDKYHGQYSALIQSTLGFSGFMITSEKSIMKMTDGGIPYTTIPDSFTGYIKYDCSNDDSANIIVVFRTSGVPIPISTTIYKVYGQDSVWTRFSFPLNKSLLPINPDTVMIGFFSSDLNSFLPNSGNTLMVDYISFVNAKGTPAAIPNNDFENWTDITDIEPNQWISLNIVTRMLQQPPCVTLTTASHSGKYAVNIKSVLIDFGDGHPQKAGVITTGNMSGYGGFKIDQKPDSFGFWYKYDNSANTLDSALAVVLFEKYDAVKKVSVVADSYQFMLPASAAYKFVSFPFVNLASKSVDTANLVFSSSNMNDTATIGLNNNITLDDISFYFRGVGVPADLVTKDLVIYPNPAAEYLQMELQIPANLHNLRAVIYSGNGQLMKENNFNSLQPGTQNFHIELGNLSKGNYLIVLYGDENRLFTKQFIVR